MKAHIISLGCPKNLSDSEVLMGKLFGAGYTFTNDIKIADIIVINTCAFLKAARVESIETIKNAIKKKKCSAKIYIAGCLPKLKKKLSSLKIDGTIESIGLFDSSTPKIKATNTWTAYVKISEGCNNNCSYCLIPKIRGKLKLRKVPDILKEVDYLAKNGTKEIIFIGQDTTAHPDLINILRAASKIKGIHWIRLMYAHPVHLSDPLINLIAENKKICKYIDLPLQHICDNILKNMRRGILSSASKLLIKKLRQKIHNLCLRTSFIVGFPGETEKYFEELLSFVKVFKFERLGVFKYSKEKGTRAYNMRGQVPNKVKNSRFQKLMSLQSQISLELNKKLIGQIFDVLVEKSGKDFCIGRTFMDAPEIDGSVKILNNGLKPGNFVKAKIISCSSYDLVAKAVT